MRRSVAAWASGVFALAVVAQLPALVAGFIDGDDQRNFLTNLAFRGLGWSQFRWAWTSTLLGVYQPVAWILLETEYAAWKLDPRGYHAASLLLHGVVSALLFLVVVQILKRADPEHSPAHLPAAALAAGLFATHPLRSEVVAWTSCQPYLPSAILTLAATLAYLLAHDGRPRSRGYLTASVGLYALAVLAKPAAIALPLALLALDLFPLRRFQGIRAALRIIGEKLPYVIIAVGAAAVALRFRRAASGGFPLVFRVEQASLGAFVYLFKSVIPTDLAAFYPFPARPEEAGPAFAMALVAMVVSVVAAVLVQRRWPGLAASWLAYLAILAPCSGLVPLGRSMLADRYAYLSTMALVPLVAWGLGRAIAAGRGAAVGLVGLCWVLALVGASWDQCATWRDPVTLWTHALEHGGARSSDVRVALGAALARRGRLDEAAEHFVEAARIEPTSASARNNLGMLALERGDPTTAARAFAEAIELGPEFADAHANLGIALTRLGQLEAAVRSFEEAIRRAPGSAEIRVNLAVTLIQLGRRPEALAQLQAALVATPDHPTALRLRKSLGS
jgi:tetratricopeptide (TPR) repeat protein